MILQTKRDRKNERGAFTLMEMLIVVAIIVALAGMGGYYFIGQLNKSKESTARSQALATITPACNAYQVDHGEWPPSLQALLQKSDKGGPYLINVDAITDPAGNLFQYNQQGTHNNGLQPDVYTTINGKMIGNWSKQQQQK